MILQWALSLYDLLSQGELRLDLIEPYMDVLERQPDELVLRVANLRTECQWPRTREQALWAIADGVFGRLGAGPEREERAA